MGHALSIQRRRGRLHATLLHNGRRYQDTVELGWFGSKAVRKTKKGVKKFAKTKAGRVVTFVPRMAHKVAKSKQLEQMHKAVQGAVGKYLPITKPFIAVHNKIAGKTHEAFASVGIGKKKKTPKLTVSEVMQAGQAIAGARAQLTTTAISKVTAKLPAVQRPAARAALMKRAALEAADLARARSEVARRVVAKASKAMTRGKAPTSAHGGVFVVKMPDGRTVSIPASKVRK